MKDPIAHALEVTARLREDEPPLGLDLVEAICPACGLAYFVASTSSPVCRSCEDDPVDMFFLLGVL